MNPIDRLAEQFGDLPGIGPRQARRFVDFLLLRDSGYLDELSRRIAELKDIVSRCESCRRHFPATSSGETLCNICRSKSRDTSQLLIVEKDIDFEAVEKSGEYHGRYFIIGSVNPRKNETPRALPDLLARIAAEKDLAEIILALSATPAGEYLSDLIAKELAPIAEKRSITLSILGRGLSTGTELEYSDRDTLKNALSNRKKK